MRYMCMLAVAVFFISCNDSKSDSKEQLCDSDIFKKYWNRGNAEISSYSLQQAQFGHLNNGEAIMVFATEDFRKDKHVQLESDARDKAIKVLKLNFIKRFVTGIHDFSMYTSVFTPVQTTVFSSTLKVSNTNQDWSGQTFLQLNFRQNGYQVLGKSYFEEEIEDDYHIDKAMLEDELWNRIRLVSCNELPVGKVILVPGLASLRLRREKAMPSIADITLEPYKGDSTFKGDSLMDYRIKYAESQRSLRIIFEKHFPHKITGWEESYQAQNQVLTSRAVLKATIQNPYWEKNMPADTIYRKKLNLKY
ncbi:hypothetical protein [Emticicia sp. 17c]|uniref:hypothetical protein n=1 Tax=Emticicia sp. 17c TaxID=3127704 RepID=UPI00301E1056